MPPISTKERIFPYRAEEHAANYEPIFFLSPASNFSLLMTKR